MSGPRSGMYEHGRALEVIAQLVDVVDALAPAEAPTADFVAPLRAEYPDVFARLDEHQRERRADARSGSAEGR